MIFDAFVKATNCP